MRIRAAAVADLASIAALFEELDALHRDRLPDRFAARATAARSDDSLRALIRGATGALLLADAGGDVVGVIHLALRDTPAMPMFIPRRLAVVEDLVVAAGARRRGIGRALMAAADRWARDRGAASVELTVYDVNHEATAFYRALGCEVLSHRLTRPLTPGGAAGPGD